ncbi:hypothetical protein E4U42_003280 [Claviceps africana]|uniref:N-acetyltransferase B complex non catalytic subunit n=1 Tax=Claviceps africana TaxID=83212 RepID=A0A8K0J9J3_9HYPO|nr:hypothetical protein E4U42_003280 [Claviceps africana]
MNHQRPRLRNGTDLQLQSAFQDGNWAVAMRLAQQRARTFNDQYFEVVKICAESQLDDPNAKFAAVAAIDRFVKEGTVFKDVDAIDLLDWATVELVSEEDFAQTMGLLRVRSVKASPKDRVVATRCLQSCLLHWDLNGAQQIAAIIDRSFPQDRDFMFWNIVITHMLAMSSQAPPDKKKLYAMLAQKQIERAAQLTEQAHASQTAEKPARGIRSEQEMLLLYDIVETHGTAEDLSKLINSPVFSPVVQFRMGRKELFRRVASKYKTSQQWAALCDLCHECLSAAGEDGELTLLACDWSVWRHFLEAAVHVKSSNAGMTAKLQDLLVKVVKTKNLKPIYKRNILLAKVSAAFELEARDGEDVDSDDKPSSARLRHLLLYVEDQKTSIACFNDIKEFVEKLDASGLKHVAYVHVPALAKAAEDSVTSARIRLLSLKLQYFLTTCPILRTRVAGRLPASRCVVCDSVMEEAESCHACLSKISCAALEAYESATNDLKEHAAVQDEVLPELALAVALCNVQMAFRIRPGYHAAGPPKSEYLVRALLMLEHQVFLTPKHSQICLVLVQLHLLLGSAHRCREIWQGLGVKRTIVDSLAPIFYDRLSTVAPVILDSSDDWGWDLGETLRGHFATSLKMPMPRRLVDAFEAGSYGSVIDMPKYTDNLRFGCTKAMSLVEEVRADRLLGEPCGEFLNDERFDEVSDDVDLRDAVDYGSFPSWGSSASMPLHERLRLGPSLSNTRAHLSLLAEAFHHVLLYRPPTVYKTTAAVLATEYTFVMEMMSQLGNSMSKFLADAAAHCTASETLYFETLHLLATLVPWCGSHERSAPPPDAAMLGEITSAIEASLASQLDGLADPADSMQSLMSTLGSLHRIAMLRDTAVATKLATGWILNERDKERDRSGGGHLPKDVAARLKGLQSRADASLGQGKRLISSLQAEVANEAELGRRLREWALEGARRGGALDGLVEDGTVKEVIESWALNVRGWGQVKWDV